MNIIVVLPTYNEAETWKIWLKRLWRCRLDDHLSVLIADDNSPDGTGQIADRLAQERPDASPCCTARATGPRPRIHSRLHRGAGARADAIPANGLRLSHSPSYIPQMIETLRTRECDIVIGSRYIKGGRLDETWDRAKLLSWWANSVYVRLILHTKASDATGGFRLWRREVLRQWTSTASARTATFSRSKRSTWRKSSASRCARSIYFADRTAGTSKMSFRIQSEAALRVWQVWLRHRHLTPADRRPLPDRAKATL